MSAAWLIGTVIAAAAVVVAAIPLWRSRHDRRAQLTPIGAALIGDGRLRVRVMNGGRANAFHAEVSVEGAESSGIESGWLGFVSAGDDATADVEVPDEIVAEGSARFRLLWDDEGGRRRSKLSKTRLKDAVRVSEGSQPPPEPERELAFVLDRRDESVSLAKHHKDILQRLGFDREGAAELMEGSLVMGVARSRHRITVYARGSETLSQQDQQRIIELVSEAYEREGSHKAVQQIGAEKEGD